MLHLLVYNVEVIDRVTLIERGQRHPKAAVFPCFLRPAEQILVPILFSSPPCSPHSPPLSALLLCWFTDVVGAEQRLEECKMPSVILATAGYDHTIRFWEAPTGTCYRTIQLTPDSVRRPLRCLSGATMFKW